MLKDFEKSKHEEKEVLNEEIKSLRARLIGQQQQIREKKLPVLVLIEGWAAAGKVKCAIPSSIPTPPRFRKTAS